MSDSYRTITGARNVDFWPPLHYVLPIEINPPIALVNR